MKWKCNLSELFKFFSFFKNRKFKKKIMETRPQWTIVLVLIIMTYSFECEAGKSTSRRGGEKAGKHSGFHCIGYSYVTIPGDTNSSVQYPDVENASSFDFCKNYDDKRAVSPGDFCDYNSDVDYGCYHIVIGHGHQEDRYDVPKVLRYEGGCAYPGMTNASCGALDHSIQQSTPDSYLLVCWVCSTVQCNWPQSIQIDAAANQTQLNDEKVVPKQSKAPKNQLLQTMYLLFGFLMQIIIFYRYQLSYLLRA